MEKLKKHLKEILGLNERKVRKDKIEFDEEKFSEILNKIQNILDSKNPTPQETKLINCFSSFDEETLNSIIKNYLHLGFDDMKRVATIQYWLRGEKYHREKKRLLGAQTRVISDEVYQKEIPYVRHVYGEKIALALETEGIEGARGEDIVILKDYDINTDTHMIHFHNQKLNREYDVPLNKNLEIKLVKFIEDNKEMIESHNHYIFFSENPVKSQNKVHISQRYLKNVVAKVLEDLNLNVVYAISSDGRKLHIGTLHGHRSHAATEIYNKSGGDITKAGELLNHNPGSTVTSVYIEKNIEKDLRSII